MLRENGIDVQYHIIKHNKVISKPNNVINLANRAARDCEKW